MSAPAAVSVTAALGGMPASLPMHPHEIAALFWIGVLPVVVVVVAAALAVAAGKTVALRKDADASSPRQALRYLARGILEALVYVGVLAGVLFLGRVLNETQGADMALRCGSAVALLWAGFMVLDVFERQLHGRFQAQGRHAAITAIPLLDKVAKASLSLLILLLFLDNMGLNVKALLAGLGVGGLAVALAGQKTIENLFGGLMLVLDQPVRAGDFCGFGDKTGEVVEVGLRSIKLRTADRTVITVPNGEFSQLTLENFAKRDCIRFDTILGLRLDTGPARVTRIVEALEAVLKADPHVDTVLGSYVRFIRVGVSSLDLEVFCYFHGPDWNAFMLWRQALLLTLLEVVEREGGRLAFPTQTLVSETVPLATHP